MKQNFFQQLGITPVQAGAGAFAVMAIYAGAKKLGLVKGEEDSKAANLSSEKMFEPTFLETLPTSQKVMKFSSAHTVPEISERIYKAKGFFKDDMPKLWGAIKRMKYKTQVAQVNSFFNRKYGKEMFSYMKTFLNSEELSEIWDYLSKLPSGLV